NMARLESCSCGVLQRSRHDSFSLQFALADRACVLSARVFSEDGAPGRLSREIWPASGNIRPRIAHTPGETKVDMAACSQRGRSNDRPQAGPAATTART